MKTKRNLNLKPVLIRDKDITDVRSEEIQEEEDPTTTVRPPAHEQS